MKFTGRLTKQLPHLLSTGDLSKQQLNTLLKHSAELKDAFKKNAIPPAKLSIPKSLDAKTVAVLFNKRSTRTRVAAETSLQALGGHPLFLSPSDIQLGVNESLEDTARVVSSMTDGIFARVGAHSEIETLAKYSSVPVINALSDLYHPTQILADLLTISEVYGVNYSSEAPLSGLTFSWVGDANNIINDTLLSLPRLGAIVKVGCPQGYEIDNIIIKQLEEQGILDKVLFTSSPLEAVKDADVIVTDTWISMGQEDEKTKRLNDFKGFQVTEELARKGGAKDNWIFMHCLPRKTEEVDDHVFYGARSKVFQEAENRKWTIMSIFDKILGEYRL
ncbi:ornithine carbamoyltransferase [Wallemia mellicola CBS 633.66]|uniref:ornithine carbamoyltransferase n=1 Tax=Wallemia mellicola (strain ATCC MYA-4683 / CBS 633.66) TaxID=671144 RepID=I4YH40_WALMC|nr:ornithine carbamoyltransferase [Wallemia mellicola CBS 633.66]EIM23282.1 ornithine carbamoyltransferase [Wallemia mellicola CBS 633.66]TIB94181.1 ornithine carbamoyltransferase [Wallemia mellicola]TIB96472.1 ornithine carbamoyltransferase [Wallemia mellicola]TIC75964.1 ornithine carbamoyltransferase [Wallemia mellicola]|eukprot:XP_006956672.1 ornithine carbamoyltransferase [Wallemia mellicola CBS 633.66]